MRTNSKFSFYFYIKLTPEHLQDYKLNPIQEIPRSLYICYILISNAAGEGGEWGWRWRQANIYASIHSFIVLALFLLRSTGMAGGFLPFFFFPFQNTNNVLVCFFSQRAIWSLPMFYQTWTYHFHILYHLLGSPHLWRIQYIFVTKRRIWYN